MGKRYKKPSRTIEDTISSVIALVVVLFIAYNAYTKGKLPVSKENLYIILGATASLILLYVFGKAFKSYLNRRKYLKSDISSVDKMTGDEFEKYLKARFEKEGWAVSLTKTSGDMGADLVMTKRTSVDFKKKIVYGPQKMVVQAKRYSKNIGVKAIQEVVASKAVYGADSAAVATNRYFTAEAKKVAKANGVILYDRDYFWKIRK